jgi:hypothetical protein
MPNSGSFADVRIERSLKVKRRGMARDAADHFPHGDDRSLEMVNEGH